MMTQVWIATMVTQVWIAAMVSQVVLVETRVSQVVGVV